MHNILLPFCVKKKKKDGRDEEETCQVTPVLRDASDSYVKSLATFSCHRCTS